MPEPPGSSSPVQDTSHSFASLSEPGFTVSTLLDGEPLSMVFNQVFVLMAAFVSNTIEALFVICVPVARPERGLIVKETCPSPLPVESSGGRNPTDGSLGSDPVIGSMVERIHCTRPDAAL